MGELYVSAINGAKPLSQLRPCKTRRFLRIGENRAVPPSSTALTKPKGFYIWVYYARAGAQMSTSFQMNVGIKLMLVGGPRGRRRTP